MDLYKIKCFIAVVEEGSISKAAIKLNMTQPPLSMMIKNLEEELDVMLFERKGKKLVISEPGKLLYKRSKDLLYEVDIVKEELHEQKSGLRGVINVRCSTSASLFIIPEVIEIMRKESPNVIVRVREGNSEDILSGLEANSIDVGILRTRSPFVSENINTSLLLKEPLLLAIAKDHRLLKQDKIELIDLKNENFISTTKTLGIGMSNQIMEECQAVGFTPNIVYWGTELLPILFMVNREIGISFAPRVFTHLQFDLPAFVPIAGADLSTSLNVVTKKYKIQSPIVTRFIQLAEEVARRYY